MTKTFFILIILKWIFKIINHFFKKDLSIEVKFSFGFSICEKSSRQKSLSGEAH